jgi:hypothetical protein
MTKKKADPICRSFRQDFPQFVARAKALGVRISLGSGRKKDRERVFWLDGYRQLTGYTTRSDGWRFTHEDAVRNIDKALTGIEEDRAAISGMSLPERFARVMAEFRQMVPRDGMIGEVRLRGGDRGHVWFMSNLDGEVDLHGVGTVAKAEAKWRQGEMGRDQMARWCDAIEADFALRQKEAA